MKRVERKIKSVGRVWSLMALAFVLGIGSYARAEPIFEQASGLSCEERLFLCHQEEARLEEAKRQCEKEKRTCKRRLRNCRNKLEQCEVDADEYRRKAEACEAQLASVIDVEPEVARLSRWEFGSEEPLVSRSQSLPLGLGLGIDAGGQIGSLFCEAQLALCRPSVGVKEIELESCRDGLANMPCTKKLDECNIDVEFCEEERDQQKRRWLECRAVLNQG